MPSFEKVDYDPFAPSAPADGARAPVAVGARPTPATPAAPVARTAPTLERVNYDPFAHVGGRPTPAGQSDDGDFMRGFKRTLPELKQLAGGTLAAIGDVTGWDGLRDKGLEIYRNQEKVIQPLQKPTDSASEAWNQVKQGNLGAGADFLQNAAGYTAGQALESVAAAGAGAAIGGVAGSEVPVAGNLVGAGLGAVGGFVGKQLIKRGVKEAAEKLIAERVGQGVAKHIAEREAAEYVAANTAKEAVAEQVGKRYTKRQLAELGGRVAGGAAGAQGLNTVMEVGSVYPEALQGAQDEGRDLTGGEKARALTAALGAAGLESVADMFNLGVLFRGVKGAAGTAARTGLKSALTEYGKRAAVAGTEGALREAGTEGAQTFLERVGANQSLNDADAWRDYVDSAAVGAVGGVLFGAGAALHEQKADKKQPPPKVGFGEDPADQLRADVLQASTSEDRDAAHTRLVDYLAQNGRLIGRDGAPITVGPDGTAMTGTQRQQVARAEADRQAGLADIGLTPDVRDAQQEHPAFTRPVPQVPFPDAETPGALGTMANAANALPPRPTGRVLNQGMFERQLAEQQQDKQRREEAAATPSSLPWFNSETGELGEPTDDQLRQYVHETLNQQAAGRGIDRKAIERTLWNSSRVPPERLGEIWRQVVAERKTGLTGPAALSAAPPAQGALDMRPAPAVARSDAAPDGVLPEAAAASGATTTQAAPAALEGGAAPASAEGASTARAERVNAMPPSSVGVMTRPTASPSAKASGSALGRPAPTDVARERGELNVLMNGREFAVDTVEDASAKFLQMREKVGDLGGMHVVQLTNKSGRPIGYIGHNGEVYEGVLGRNEAKLLYDPKILNRVGSDHIEGEAVRTGKQGAIEAPDIHAAAHEAATSAKNALPVPTEAQKEAGNYKKGHVQIAGLDISIENPAGSKRRPEWPALKHHYGYIKGSIGKDKDHVDVFLTKNAADTSLPVFVIDQRSAAGRFDEHKVILGTKTEAQAKRAYLANYSKGWDGAAAITQMTHEEFEAWVRDPDKTTRPATQARPVLAAHQKAEPAPAPASAQLELRALTHANSGSLNYSTEGSKKWLLESGYATERNRKLALTDTGKMRLDHLLEKHRDELMDLGRDGNGIGGDLNKGATTETDAEGQRYLVSKPNARGIRATRPYEGNKAPDLNSTEKPPTYVDLEGFEAKFRPPPAPRGPAPTAEPKAGAEAEAQSEWREVVAELEDDEVRALAKRLGIAGDAADALRQRLADTDEAVADPIYMEMADNNEFAYQDADRFEPEEDWDYKVAHFPEPARSVNAIKASGTYITPEEAQARLAEWKAEAKRIGEAEDHSKDVILSLFDASGEITKPWREAGYDVRQYDIQHGDDLLEYPPISDIHDMLAQGKRIVGLIAQPPCTCFTSSGARWWAERHDAHDRAMVQRMFGREATKWFSKPKEYTRALVSIVDMLIGEAKPLFHAMENPVGRIATQMGLPKPTLVFDPNVYGNPYTKRTQLWGNFNPDLPTANVEPTQGSLIHKLWSTSEKNGGARSLTPEGFAYAFFMANKDAANAAVDDGQQDEMDAEMRGYEAKAAAKGVEPLSEDEWKQLTGAGRARAMKAVGITKLSPMTDYRYLGTAELAKLAGPVREILAEGAPAAENTPAQPAPIDKSAKFNTPIEDVYPQGKKAARGFGKPESVTAAIEERGLNPDDYTIERTPLNGYYGKRKAPAATLEGAVRAEVAKFAGNKLFTADKVEAAKARMRAKLGHLNSGVDPELLIDGMTIAGAYIESGVRKFADYAKAMVDDLGDAVKPYLLAFYEGARRFPGLDAKGMDSVDDAAAAHEAMLTPADLKTEAIGNAKPPRKTRSKAAPNDRGNRTLRDDWGVEAIDGYTALPGREGEAQRTDFGLKGGVKTAFLDDARAYLKAVADQLEDQGFTVALDRKGKPGKAVTVNEGGPAVSGDVMLHMVGPSGSTGIYVTIGESALRGVVPGTSNDVSLMYRTTNASDSKSGPNQWGRVDLTAADLAAELAGHVERNPWREETNRGGLPVHQVIVRTVGRDGLTEDERAAGKKAFSTLSEAQMARLEQIRDSMAKSEDEFVAGGRKDLDLAIEQSRKGEPETAVLGTLDRAYNRVNRQFPAQAETIGQIQDEIADGRAAPSQEKAQNPRQETPDVRRQENPEGNRPDDVGADQREQPAEDGSDDTAAHLAAGQPEAPARAGRGGQAAAEAQGRAAPGAVRGERGADAQRAPDADRVPAASRAAPDAVVPHTDFTIDNELDFRGVGAVGKFKNNLAAIALVKQLEAEGRRATAEEQSVLAKYVGWGGLPQAFRHPSGRMAKGWEARVAELEQALTPEELAAAARSTQDAHYTAANVVRGIWGAVAQLGFDHGRVLEPSVGVGNFFGLMPHEARAASHLTGVELDPITGRIAQQLYQKASVQVRGFNDITIAPGSFDLAIGNPPFGAQAIHDPQYPELRGFSIHNYFFAKSVASLRPGGVLAMVVSNSFLDANASSARAWIAERARLVGAIRLPQTAFQQNAGTAVTTDIVFLQRLAEGEQGNAEEWVRVGSASDKGNAFALNRYFIAHPDMMLGRMAWSSHTTHNSAGAVLEAHEGQDLGEALAAAVAKLPKDVYRQPGKGMEAVTKAEQTAEVPSSARVYGYFVQGGKLYQRQPDHSTGEVQSVPVDLPEGQVARVGAMAHVRDLTRDLLQAERTEGGAAHDKLIEAKRAELNRAYDAFVKEHGRLSREVNKRLFRDDPDIALLLSLEKDYDKGVSSTVAKKMGVASRKESAKKADLFTKRLNYPERPVTSVSDAKSAMLASLNERGRLDPEFMAQIYGKDLDTIEHELGDLVFRAPAGDLQPADIYLSGNVKAKLAEARAALRQNPAMERNVAALEAVQPADIDPSDVFVQVGTPWIPATDYGDFARETFEGALSGSYVHALGGWRVRIDSRNQVLNQDRWGTPRMPAGKILERLMEGKPIVVQDKDSEGKLHVNREETAAAKGKAEEMQTAFLDWIWKDAARRERLARFYNDTYNTDVRWKPNGDHLTLPGKTGAITLRPHQNNYVYRIIQTGDALADHVVGAGKTFAAIAAVMEMRRLGLWRKPMIVVPNHLVDQWAADFAKLYPGANVLAASRKDFEKAKRKRLFGRIATGDWDAVIVAHSSFGFIPLPPATEKRILEDEVAEITQALDAMRADNGKKDLSFKELQKRQEAITEKIKALADRKRDDLLDFAEMGVDAVTVDEAHEFKNLYFVTTQRGVAGLGSPEGSKKAFDLFVKTRYLEELGGRNRQFLTGTPVSNSLAEVFHMQRYLQMGELQSRNLAMFDTWAGTFGQIVSDWEMDAAGRFKEKARFRKFANLPELVTLWRKVADTVTMADLKRDAQAQGKTFPVPKIKGGKRNNITVPRSPLQAAYIGVAEPVLDAEGKPVINKETGIPEAQYPKGSIIWRMDNMPKDPREDNHLKASGDARKASLDYRLIDPDAPDFPGSKINRMVAEVVQIWRDNAARRGTQLIFCDLSTPASARGKATAAAQDRVPTWFVNNEDGIEHVAGVKLSLSAMPQASFFSHKDKLGHTVYEASSGLRISSGKTKQDAIDAANGQLARNPAQWNGRFAENAIPGDVIDAYIQRWEDARAAAQAALEADGKAAGSDDDEGSEQETISMDDLLADQSKFSVYDDVRAKLLAAGIPANEIAFIHDYNTDAQKADLFAKVNRGDIRVLMGSTAKMGAGMNVQRKLVGLHHADAPWRPSDMEQREGRAIRQGNEFYEADPDGFEMVLNAYGTQESYDSRQYEIIETKARGIETFKAGATDTREIDDIASESASSAEMKAAASGNPLILESQKLRKDVRDMESQARSHQSSVHAMETLIRGVDNKTAYAYKAQRDAIARQQKYGVNPWSLTIGGKTFTDPKQVKAEAVLTAFKAAIDDKGTQGIDAGQFRGLDLVISSGFSALRLGAYAGDVLVGNTEFTKGENPNVQGFVTRLDNIFKRLDVEVAESKARVEKTEREAETAREEVKRGYPRQQELEEKRARLAKVIAALRSGKRSVEGDPEPEGAAPTDGVAETVQVREDAASYGNTRPVQNLPERARVAASKSAAPGRGTAGLFTAQGSGIAPRAAALKLSQSARVVETGQFRSGIKQVKGWQDAAHIIAPLRKSAQEQMLALVLDKTGKPLAVIRHTIGVIDGAEVEPWSLVGAIAAVPRAAAVYFAHNHPSGRPSQSAADRRMTSLLKNLLDGSGIEPRGMIVVAPGSREATFSTGDGPELLASPTPSRRSGAVPQLERALRKVFQTKEVKEITMMSGGEAAGLMHEHGTGVLLLDTRNHAIGYLPISDQDMRKLRTGDPATGTAAVLRTVAEANARAAIIISATDPAGKNIATLLRQSLVQVLDRFAPDGTGAMVSVQARGKPVAGDHFYSREATGRFRPGVPLDRAQQLVNELTAHWGSNAPTVRLVQSAQELQQAAGLPASVLDEPGFMRSSGLYRGKPTVWLNLGAIADEQRLAEVLAHEALGHFGIERVVKDWPVIIDTISRHAREGTGAADVRAAIEQVRRTQPMAERDPETFAKEVIAVMAERGARNGLMQRIVAAVRRFLRQFMPSLRWTDAEIRDLLGQADSFLRSDRAAASRVVPATAPQFAHEDRGGVDEAGSLLENNGSGDSSASIEAINRARDERAAGQIRAVIDRDGSVRPLLGVDAVDTHARAGQIVVQRGIGRAEWTMLSQGADVSRDLAAGRINAARAALADLVREEAPALASREDQTKTPAFKRWFGDSKVVDDAGAPLVVFHGTAGMADDLAPQGSAPAFEEFSARRRGSVTGSSDSKVGFWFSADRARAESAADDAMAANRKGGRAAHVMDVYLRIENPLRVDSIMDTDPAEIASLARQAKLDGHDGLIFDEGEGEGADYMVFRPEQIKSANDNSGAFDRGDASILFSREPAEAIDAIETEIRQVDHEVQGDTSVIGRARALLQSAVPKKLKDATRGSWLGGLTLRHLVELGSDYFPTMKIYGDYQKAMEADRNQLQQEGEHVAEAARKWAGKNLPEAGRMFDLMHDATILGVDPAEEYKPLQFRYSGQLREVNKKNVKEALAAIREQARGRAGDNKTDLFAEIKGLKAMLAAEPKRKASYPGLVARWNQLSTEAKDHYVAMRDLYAKRSREVEEGLVQRIRDLRMEGGENHKRLLINHIRQQFEFQRLQGVYFPLQRFGKYFVAAEKDDTPTFQMFESLNDLEKAVKGLRARGFTIKAQGLKQESKSKDAPSGTFVADVIAQLKKAGVSDATQDEIYQLYLQALPELSMRKHAIHRKAVIGFDPDALRAFAFNMTHGAHQLARLRYAHKLADTIDVLQGQQDSARTGKDADTRKVAAGDAVLDELRRRHEWISNPTDSNATNLVSSFGFGYYLGTTPAAAIVNLTQTALISFPFLASRFGAGKAMNQLLSTMAASARTLGHIQRTLTDPDELRAHAVLQKMGAIDKTQTHNLAGIAEGGLTGHNPKWAKAMEVIGWGFHKTEVINREATGIAAFRLARGEGKSFDEAVAFAADAILDTHYDYSNANRARFMQSGAAKVLLMFRQYSLNTTWHLGRMVWNATKAADPEVKRIARRNLVGVLGMSSLFSGVLGLPLMSVTMGVLNAIAASLGDDDDPWDAETEFRAFLNDMFGPGPANAILGGVVNPVTGADFASRVSLSQLWFRDADRELDGEGAYYNLLEIAAGPMGGVLKNALVGKQLIDEGHLQRGVETMLPKALKDGLKATRYATEGVNNLRGDPIVADLSLRQVLLQLGGFTPSEVADQYDHNRALKNYEQAILERHQRLMDAYAMAVRTGDVDARRDAREKILEFNRKYREIAITPESLRKSLRARARYSKQAEGGIFLNPKIAARVRAAVDGGDE